MSSSLIRIYLPLSFLLHSTLLTNPSAGVVVAKEDFDGNAVNLSSTTNIFNFGVGAGGGSGSSVFGRVSKAPGTGMPLQVSDDSVTNVGGMISGSSFPGDTIGIAGQHSTSFFAMNDMTEVTLNGSPLNNAIWRFDLSVTPGTIENIQIDMAAMGVFDASKSQGFLVQARVDANSYATIFEAKADNSISKAYRAFDGGISATLNRPLQLFIDGNTPRAGLLDKSNPTTGKFDTYTSTRLAGQSGTSLDIQLIWTGNAGGSNPMGIDNITINSLVSVPEPSAFLFGGLVCSIIGGSYVRRRLQMRRKGRS